MGVVRFGEDGGWLDDDLPDNCASSLGKDCCNVAMARTQSLYCRYCERSGVKWAAIKHRRIAIPCDCGEPICEGLQMFPRNWRDW